MNKGCLYWILIGCWLEPMIWIFKLSFKMMYWICIGWWINLIRSGKSKNLFLIIFALVAVGISALGYEAGGIVGLLIALAGIFAIILFLGAIRHAAPKDSAVIAAKKTLNDGPSGNFQDIGIADNNKKNAEKEAPIKDIEEEEGEERKEEVDV